MTTSISDSGPNELARPRTRFTLGMLAVIGSAAFVGVQLTIGLSLGSYWLGLEPLTFAEWFTDNFVFLVPSAFLTLGPAMAGVIGSLWLTRAAQSSAALEGNSASGRPCPNRR